jgi:hypothetical protein
MSVAPLPVNYNHHPTFSQARYKRHDSPAKEVVKSLLIQQGYTIVNEDEGYGSHDFIVNLQGTELKVEVEQKTAWVYEMFPFTSHRVSHRKHTSKADLFFQISKNEKYVAMCPMAVVKSSPVVRTNTCLGSVNEPFFDVPCSAMKYYVYEDGVWYESE